MVEQAYLGEGPNVPGEEKYNEERDKRVKAEGLNQYIDLNRSEKYKAFIEDPWVQKGEPINTPVSDGGQTKVLIFGAGFGGILFAVKLIQAGFRVDDILIVDAAGGFGGTWYWNRYPGLMCDVESYIYFPLLEEMDYMPKRRYASGVEIRQYVESVCSKFDLHRRAMFQCSGKTVEWDESKGEWNARIIKKPKGGVETEHTVRADFVLFASGVLNNPKLPDIEGIRTYNGKMFHTARFDYSITGGTPQTPHLNGLRGKNVAVVGTGATAIQLVPEVAKYAQHVYLFQRTPSSVDRRDNLDTDPDAFETKVATGRGWQKSRNLNFVAHVENTTPPPSENLVDDGWSHFASYSGLVGTSKTIDVNNVADHVSQLYALDFPRQERIRERTADIVKDPVTARSLQAWYHGWCKRPCFHDDFLQTFNLPNVQLVDTDGRGIDRINENGVEHQSHQYDLDVIIWSTGFRSPGLGSPAGKADIVVKGRDGVDMEQLNDTGDLLTLHGVSSRAFPNMFSAGVAQSAVTANYTFVLNNITAHVAHIMAEVTSRAKAGTKPVVEPTLEAQDEWAARIMEGAATFAAIQACTPSYINKEGEIDRMTHEEQIKAAKRGLWPNGYATFLEELEEWRAKGTLPGLEVTYV